MRPYIFDPWFLLWIDLSSWLFFVFPVVHIFYSSLWFSLCLGALVVNSSVLRLCVEKEIPPPLVAGAE